MLEQLPQRLQDRRNQLKLTQQELATITTNLTAAWISHYECGRRKPSIEHLSALADALQTTTDYLLGRTTNIN